MNYMLKSGILYGKANMPQARLKRDDLGSGKKIFHMDGTLAAKTEIRHAEEDQYSPGDVRNRTYILTDCSGTEMGIGHPHYAPGEDPLIAGWPVCRLPRVDRATIHLGNSSYTLSMLNSQNYLMKDDFGKSVLQIIHRGLNGGWNIEAEEHFSEEEICGMFVFCRYIEQENEFLIV